MPTGSSRRVLFDNNSNRLRDFSASSVYIVNEFESVSCRRLSLVKSLTIIHVSHGLKYKWARNRTRNEHRETHIQLMHYKQSIKVTVDGIHEAREYSRYASASQINCIWIIESQIYLPLNLRSVVHGFQSWVHDTYHDLVTAWPVICVTTFSSLKAAMGLWGTVSCFKTRRPCWSLWSRQY